MKKTSKPISNLATPINGVKKNLETAFFLLKEIKDSYQLKPFTKKERSTIREPCKILKAASLLYVNSTKKAFGHPFLKGLAVQKINFI